MNEYRYISTSGRFGYYKKWNFIKASSYINAVQSIHDELFKIWDADNCGSDTNYIRIYDVNEPETEYYVACQYSWYIETDPEWNLIDDLEIVVVQPEEVPDYLKNEYLIGDRDWIVL